MTENKQAEFTCDDNKDICNNVCVAGNWVFGLSFCHVFS